MLHKKGMLQIYLNEVREHINKDPFADIVDVMLNPGKDHSSDCHLLRVCDVSAKDFVAVCEIKRHPQSNL